MKIPIKQWKAFKTSLCKSCWATCCHDMPLEASISDLIRLGFLTEDEAVHRLDQVAANLKKLKIIQKFFPQKMVFLIAQKKNKDCVFLDENRRCSVYSNRPEICRQFPKKIGPKPGFCPYLPKDA